MYPMKEYPNYRITVQKNPSGEVLVPCEVELRFEPDYINTPGMTEQDIVDVVRSHLASLPDVTAVLVKRYYVGSSDV